MIGIHADPMIAADDVEVGGDDDASDGSPPEFGGAASGALGDVPPDCLQTRIGSLYAQRCAAWREVARYEERRDLDGLRAAVRLALALDAKIARATATTLRDLAIKIVVLDDAFDCVGRAEAPDFTPAIIADARRIVDAAIL